MAGPALLVAAFLLGAVPFGYLIGRAVGVDVRRVGSGNIGAGNLLRSVGRWAAVCTLLLDAGKGALPAAAARGAGLSPEWLAAVVAAAVLGHVYTPFLRFRGGKGVATGLGVVLAALPAVGLTAVLVWLLTALCFRYSSLAALVAAGSLPVATAAWEGRGPLLALVLALAAITVVRHHENIRRLWRGEEQKIGQRSVPVSQ